MRARFRTARIPSVVSIVCAVRGPGLIPYAHR